MTPLSPAAQAIDSAVYGPGPGATRRDIAAAALQAAVDRVVPEHDCRDIDTEEWLGQSAVHQALYTCRFKFLAIAAELVAPTTQVRRTNDDSHHK